MVDRRGSLNELADRGGGEAGVLPRSMRRDLLAAGYGEDAVFECVVAAAVGAGLHRLRAVERPLRDCPP